MNRKQPNLEVSTFASITPLEIGLAIGGLVPEDSPRQLVVVEFLRMTDNGRYLYRLEVRDLDGVSVEETLP